MRNLETTKYLGILNAANEYKHTLEDVNECVEDSYKYRTLIKL